MDERTRILEARKDRIRVLEAKLAQVWDLAEQLDRAAHENRVNPGKAATYEEIAGDLLSLRDC